MSTTRALFTSFRLSAADNTLVVSYEDSDSTTLSYKILQIADIHYTGYQSFSCRNPPKGSTVCRESNMTDFIAALLDSEQPDLVVFTGDQVEGSGIRLDTSEMTTALHAYSAEVIKRGIPWAMVYGNHDEGGVMSRDAMFNITSGLPFSVSKRGPTNVTGVGNYELNVEAPYDGPWGDAGKTLLRLYFLDSGKEQLEADQVEYYKSMAQAHDENDVVPALMFFHIPLHEYDDVNKLPVIEDGAHDDAIENQVTNTGLFQALVDVGDVKATFVGHDHGNDFCFNNQGINLCYGGGAGYGAAYGNEIISRRARMIQWTMKDGRREIVTWHHMATGDTTPEYVLYRE